MKITILTLGCKVNQAESSLLEEQLLQKGNRIVSLSENPDFCVVNTCSVTAKSDYQSRQIIRRAVRSGAEVIVTGCYAQLHPDAIGTIEGIKHVVMNNNKANIINIIDSSKSSNTSIFSSRSRPHVKIQDGCNFNCSYCIVPLARGRSRSLPTHEVIGRIASYADEGYHEIVLTGIHIGSYGHDLKPKKRLLYLIKQILMRTHISRIRISSLEINEIDDEFVEIIQDKRICSHLHIPLQSGDDEILKQMKRNYTVRDFEKTMHKIDKKVPGISFGTDMISCFPGEGPTSFLNTVTFIERLPLSYIHIFPFSPRPDTPAALMPGAVPHIERRARLNTLRDVHTRKKDVYARAQIGKKLEMIVEKIHNNSFSGKSGNYLDIKVTGKSAPKKSLISVEVTGLKNGQIVGNLINIL
jgi:threonylcarbamoyladenosine tRNA methylthiotransferase MtaB